MPCLGPSSAAVVRVSRTDRPETSGAFGIEQPLRGSGHGNHARSTRAPGRRGLRGRPRTGRNAPAGCRVRHRARFRRSRGGGSGPVRGAHRSGRRGGGVRAHERDRRARRHVHDALWTCRRPDEAGIVERMHRPPFIAAELRARTTLPPARGGSRACSLPTAVAELEDLDEEPDREQVAYELRSTSNSASRFAQRSSAACLRSSFEGRSIPHSSRRKES